MLAPRARSNWRHERRREQGEIRDIRPGRRGEGSEGRKRRPREGGKAAPHWVGGSGGVWIGGSREHDDYRASGRAAAPVEPRDGSGAEAAASGDEHVATAVLEPAGPRQTDGDSVDSFARAIATRAVDSDSGRVCADGCWVSPAPGPQEAAGGEASVGGRWAFRTPGTQDVLPAKEPAPGSVRQGEVTPLAGWDAARDAARELDLRTNVRPELR